MTGGLARPPIGRRGAVLMLFGVAWIVYGRRIIAEPVEFDVADALFHFMAPGQVRGWAWIVAGIVALLTPFWRKFTNRGDTGGFVLAMMPPLLTAVSYFAGWVIYLLPLDITGSPEGYGSAALFGSFVGVVMIVAGWREQPQLPIPEVRS